MHALHVLAVLAVALFANAEIYVCASLLTFSILPDRVCLYLGHSSHLGCDLCWRETRDGRVDRRRGRSSSVGRRNRESGTIH